MERKDVLHTLVRFQDPKRDEFGIIRIGVFGSAARDEITDNSDVDIVVELDQPDLFTQR
jgi:hypothetical protein